MNEIGPHLDRRQARTHARVYAAALDVLRRQGIGATTFDAIAQQAGVARSTLYRNWATRDELLHDAIEEQAPFPVAPSDAPASARLDAVLQEIAAALADSSWGAVLPAALAATDASPVLAEGYRSFMAGLRAALTTIISDGKKTGDLPAALDEEDFADAILGPLFFRRLIRKLPTDPVWIGQHLRRTLAAFDADAGARGPLTSPAEAPWTGKRELGLTALEPTSQPCLMLDQGIAQVVGRPGTQRVGARRRAPHSVPSPGGRRTAGPTFPTSGSRPTRPPSSPSKGPAPPGNSRSASRSVIQAAICARDLKPSLSMRLATCRATVAGLITSSAAMALLLRPAAMSAAQRLGPEAAQRRPMSYKPEFGDWAISPARTRLTRYWWVLLGCIPRAAAIYVRLTWGLASQRQGTPSVSHDLAQSGAID